MVAADAMMSGGDGQPETLAGVTVTLDGEHAMGETMETGMDGGFAFTGLRAGTYTVTISDFPEDVSFETVSVEVEVDVGDVASADFTGHYIRTSAVEGQVIIEGEGLQGVTVTLNGGPADESFTMMTDVDGMYRFEDLRPGDYTVSISDFDTREYEFAATSQDVSVDLDETGTVSFTGVLLRTSGIYGGVRVEGMGLEGVEVTLSGAADRTAMTTAGGQYAFVGLAAGDYTVTIAVDDPAYVFESMSQDASVGDDETVAVNFDGQHARTASVSGQLFIDELTKNDMMDAGEDALPAPGVPVALVGPGVNDQRLSATGADGSFSFPGLRAGSYQLVVPIDAATAAVLAANDIAYGGPGTGYAFDLGVGETKSQGIPFDITHTTINVAVTLKGGDVRGMPIPGASVAFYSGGSEVASGMTEASEAGVFASVKVARADVDGNTVQMMVGAEGYFMDPDAEMQAVTWDPQSFVHPAADADPPAVLNDADIVNLNVNVNVNGETVTTDYGGGEALGGWEISVTSGDEAVPGAPTMLDDDGNASFMTVVAPDALPAAFAFAAADDQDDDLDGGESYESTGGAYVHTGLTLAGDAVDADPIVVTYTTQTLKVYVHHERDQVRGYTGNVLGGDVRAGGLVDLEVRQASGSGGRFTSSISNDDWDARANSRASRGAYTFYHLPADMDIVVHATPRDGYMLLDLHGLDAYRNMEENGVTGGAFGAMGGWGHTVSLCPLDAVDPTDQDHGACGSFAVVSLYEVSANVSKMRVRKAPSGGPGFHPSDPSSTSQKDITVSLTPVEGKNLAGVGRSFTTAETDDPTTAINEKSDHNFGAMAAGAYDLGLPKGWRARVGDAGAGGALDPLSGHLTEIEATETEEAQDLRIKVTPSTATFYGFVRARDGFGLEGVTVNVNGQTATTDELGRYILTGIPSVRRQYFVNTARAGFPETKPDSTNNPDTEIPGFAANTVNRHDITLTGANNTVAITGTVTEAGTNAPMKDVRIKVGGKDPLNGRTTGREDWLGQVRTGEDGTYTAIVQAQPIETPNVDVTPSKDGYHFLPASLPVPAFLGSNGTADFTGYAATKIVGRVTAPGGGMPRSEVTVTATSNTGTVLDAVTTTETGTFSVFVPTLSGTVTLKAEPQSDYGLTHPNFQNLRDSERYVWFDPPSIRPGGQIAVIPGQVLDFGTFKGNSVQPRIKTVKRVTVTDDIAAGGIVPNGGHALIEGEPTNTIEVTWEYETRNNSYVANAITGSPTAAETTSLPTRRYSAENAADGSVAADGTPTYQSTADGANVPLATMSDTASAFYGVEGNLLTLISSTDAKAGETVSHTRKTTYVLVDGDIDDYGAIALRIGHDVIDANGDGRTVSVDATSNILQHGGDNGSTGVKTLAAVDGAVTDLTATRTVTTVDGGTDTHMLTATWDVAGSPQLEQRIALEVNVSATGNQWEWIVFGDGSTSPAQPAISRATIVNVDSGSGWGDWHFPSTTATPAVTFDLNDPASVGTDGNTGTDGIQAVWEDDDGNPSQGYEIDIEILNGARNLRIDTKVDGGDWVKGPEASIQTVQSGS